VPVVLRLQLSRIHSLEESEAALKNIRSLQVMNEKFERDFDAMLENEREFADC
jgi:hypothetical protein